MRAAMYQDDGIDYFPCSYGTSRNVFRGPRRRIRGTYAAFIGGTETFGRGVAHPFPALIERQSGVACVNFGCANAGIEAFLGDPTLQQASRQARLTVLQVMGAATLSNRYYTVHPRRNDRFLRPSRLLRQLYPEVDFTEINFTNHLLATLRGVSSERFAVVVEELRDAWEARMKALLDTLGRPLVLVAVTLGARDEVGWAPFVTCEMIEKLADEGIRVQFVRLPDAAQTDADPDASVTGDIAHRRVADALADHVARISQDGVQ